MDLGFEGGGGFGFCGGFVVGLMALGIEGGGGFGSDGFGYRRRRWVWVLQWVWIWVSQVVGFGFDGGGFGFAAAVGLGFAVGLDLGFAGGGGFGFAVGFGLNGGGFRLKWWWVWVCNGFGSAIVIIDDNVAADPLARLASSGIEIDGFIEIQRRPSTEEEEIVNSITVVTTWMSPLIRYLREWTLPADGAEAHKLRIRASHFREVHEGICGNHSGARSLAHKLTRAGYYWPSLLHDATQYVKTCDKCQRFANVPRVPPEEITPITSPWPFAQWGLDIMGPFPVGTKEMCSQLNIKNHYSSPRHPQANGQVKVTNWTLLKQIKTRLEGAKNMWVEELPSVLWAYRTTVRTPTKETPFKLTFGTEAVIPVEIGLTTFRTTFHREEENEGQLHLNLDLLDETREKAVQRIALYQGRMARYYNTKVKLRRFEVGDWILRKVTQVTKDPSQGKLGSNWEGPYKVIQYYRRGTYHLKNRHGKKLPHPWNAEHLKKYYP
uniref:Integrase catalytic domain-containing protein n=1 Tax=Fagus sylvatica TaxID=28930 RepID=A0A2N9FGT7_FAGSY